MKAPPSITAMLLACMTTLLWIKDATAFTNAGSNQFQLPSFVNTNMIKFPLRRHPSSSTSSSSLKAKKLLSEDDLAKPPNQKVIDTIELYQRKNNNQNQFIASDMAAQTGLSLSETQKSLSSLASLTRASISVTNDGELLYTFPPNVQSALKSNSLRYKVQSIWKKQIWPKLFWGIRISFGVFLFISIAAIFSTLIFVQSGGGSRSDDRDDNGNNRSVPSGGNSFRMNYGIGDVLFDLFYPRPYLYSYNNYGYYGQNDPYLRKSNIDNGNDDEQRRGIFEGIFSYIFGDGDPNRNIEAARLREASRIIRANGGAVTAEQLAPFCDTNDPDEVIREDFTLNDEGFVLPIVSQLGGVPSVTDDGDIVYIFPDLQVSTMDDDIEEDIAVSRRDLEYLKELNLDFNRNPAIGNILAAALGVINLAGAIYLGQVLSSPSLSGVQLAGWFGLVQSGYPLLVTYAILFNLIPAARYAYNQRINAKINERNNSRRKWLTYLQVGGSKISQKLKAAKSFRQRLKRISKSNDETVYDTRMEIEDLAADKATRELQKFDELLRRSGKEGNSADDEPFQ